MRYGCLAAALAALGLGAPAGAQERRPVDEVLVLGEPHVVGTHRLEWRVPTAFRPDDVPGPPHLLESWVWRNQGGWLAQVGILRYPDWATSATELVDRLKAGGGDRGETVTREVRRFDPVLGTSAELQFRRAGKPEQCRILVMDRGGRPFYIETHFHDDAAKSLERALVPIVLSLRATALDDVRLVPPDDPETREIAGLKAVCPKTGLVKSTAEAIGRDLAAGFALAAALTGGPAEFPVPTIHVHAKPAVLQAIVPGPDKETPTALYLPSGRRIVAHGATTSRPGKGAPDRFEAAMLAYLDGHLATAYGLWPWIRTGCVEAAQAASLEGTTAVPALRRSALATWVKRQGAKTEWPEIGTFIRATDRLTTERDRAYALALVLAARASGEATVRELLPRYFAKLKESLDPALALDHALVGVDLAVLDAAARALLRAG